MINKLKVRSCKRALHRRKALRALSAESDAATPDVADLRLSTCVVGAVGGSDAHSALVSVEKAGKRVVLLHGFRHSVPEGAVERLRSWPARSPSVRTSGGVLELEDRARAVQAREGVDISVVCIGLVDLPRARVHLVHPEARVEIAVRGNRRANPGVRNDIFGSLLSAVVVVEDHLLVYHIHIVSPEKLPCMPMAQGCWILPSWV